MYAYIDSKSSERPERVQSSLETEVCGVILTNDCLSIVWRCVQAEVVMLTKDCLSIVEVLISWWRKLTLINVCAV